MAQHRRAHTHGTKYHGPLNLTLHIACHVNILAHSCLPQHGHTNALPPPSLFFSCWLSCCEPTLTQVCSHRSMLSAFSHHSGAHCTQPATTGCTHHGESRKALPFRVPFGQEMGPSQDLGPFSLQQSPCLCSAPLVTVVSTGSHLERKSSQGIEA